MWESSSTYNLQTVPQKTGLAIYRLKQCKAKLDMNNKNVEKEDLLFRDLGVDA